MCVFIFIVCVCACVPVFLGRDMHCDTGAVYIQQECAYLYFWVELCIVTPVQSICSTRLHVWVTCVHDDLSWANDRSVLELHNVPAGSVIDFSAGKTRFESLLCAPSCLQT